MQKRVLALEADLADRGCAAGDYRLTGTGIDHLCCTHLKRVTGNWRVIFGFAGEDEIAILRIGQHDERKGRNVYEEIYGALGLPAPRRASGESRLAATKQAREKSTPSSSTRSGV